jgi:hypothetical protein
LILSTLRSKMATGIKTPRKTVTGLRALITGTPRMAAL